MKNFEYPALFEPNGEGGYVASFRDVPEALTEGWTLEETKKNALDALITSIDFYIEDGKEFPSPSKPKQGEVMISLPASVVTKILLINEMAKERIRPSELARKMNIKRQVVNRITDVRHTTKIDTLEQAFKVLGKEIEIRVR